MNIALLLCLGASFLTTFLLTPPWIKVAHRINLVGKDMNKYGKPEVAEMGGLTVDAGFLLGILLYVAISTFYFRQDSFLTYILATISTCLIIMIVGMLDDILGWKIGLKQWQKPLLTLPASLPMAFVNAGISSMQIPFFGSVDFGMLYPLLIVPLGIVGAANGFNMLAGYNGLEAGMGVIILSTLGLIAWKTNQGYVAMLAFCMVLALLAFLIYNWYPARIFPGDTLTYSVGALIACVAILGNMEKFAVVLFLPYFADFVLPLRARMRVEAYANVRKDNSLDMPYSRVYDVTHVAIYVLKKIKGKVYEKDVVLAILLIEILLGVLVFVWSG